ncbi:MFS transporter [soil metagenome]
MSPRRIGLGVVLASTMAVATFSPSLFSILATTLRAEFGVARWQIGALVTVVMGTGALVSPLVGSAVDRVLPRHATALTLVVAGTSFLGLSLAPGYLWLAGAALVGGLGQALSNPSTNRLIMVQAEVGRRGFLTGIKQAGVQAGTFFGGILLPIGAASRLGWRGSVAMIPLVSIFGLFVLWLLVRGRPPTPVKAQTSTLVSTGPVIMRLAWFAGVLGLATGSLMTYLPSFAEETFSWSPTAAGALVAVYGGIGFLARLTAGPISERWVGHHRTLVAMALATAAAGVALALAPSGGWLWPVAVLVGIGPMAWNVIANLAVMELSPEGGAGRGSGVMMAGFLGGVATGAPLLGLSVDLLGTYRPGWVAVAFLGVVAAWIGRLVRAPTV